MKQLPAWLEGTSVHAGAGGIRVHTTRVGLRLPALFEEPVRQAKLTRCNRYRSPPGDVREHAFLTTFVAAEVLGEALSVTGLKGVLRLTSGVNRRQHQLGVTPLFVFHPHDAQEHSTSGAPTR